MVLYDRKWINKQIYTPTSFLQSLYAQIANPLNFGKAGWDHSARFFCLVLPCGAQPQILTFHSISQCENSWGDEYFGVAPPLDLCKNVIPDRFTKNIYPITTTLAAILILQSPGKITVLERFRVFGTVFCTRGPKLDAAPPPIIRVIFFLDDTYHKNSI